jgi:hypothetical protein
MASNSEIETDVNNYSIDELFAILRLEPDATDTEIRATASKLSSRMLSKGNREMAKFFFDIQNRLIELDRNDLTNIESVDNEDNIEELDENGNPITVSTVKMVDTGIPNREKLDVASNDDQKIQEVDGVRQFFPVGVARGMNNPNQVNTLRNISLQ